MDIALADLRRNLGMSGLHAQDKQVAAILRMIDAGDYDSASRALNRALFYRIDHASYQFLNGLNYHLMSSHDVSLRPLARQGYLQAVRFDGAHWLAHYLLGVLELEARNHAQAVEHLAEAFLLSGENEQVMRDLGIAAYYAVRPGIAAGLFRQLAVRDPGTKAHLANYAMALAALGRFDDALAAAEAAGDGAPHRDLVTRILRWQDYHDNAGDCRREPRARAAPRAPGGLPTPAPEHCPPAPNGDRAGAHGRTLPYRDGVPGFVRAQFFEPEADYSRRPMRRLPGTERDPGAFMMDWPKARSDRMVVLEVVILHTVEHTSRQRGVNLLEGLKAQFGFEHLRTSRSDDSDRDGTSRIIVRNVGASGLDYTLNIANAAGIRNEILAKPSLIATDGVPSRFFSGINVNAAAVGGGNYGAVLHVEKDIGVAVTLLPSFLEDGRVKLAISAERSDLALHDPTSIGFELRIDTIKTTVQTEVVANLGETIILSGLVDRLREQFSTEVPILGRIPILNLFLSQRRSIDLQNSVLMLVTPRHADSARVAETPEAESDSALDALQQLYREWFPVDSTPSRAALRELRGPRLHRFVRPGDVAYGTTGRTNGARARLGQVLAAAEGQAE